LSGEERRELLRSLITELDTPADPNVEKAWLEAAQRRYLEVVEGKVKERIARRVRPDPNYQEK
jgi:hypothetical protein